MQKANSSVPQTQCAYGDDNAGANFYDIVEAGKDTSIYDLVNSCI